MGDTMSYLTGGGGGGGALGSRSTPGFYLIKYLQLFAYIQTMYTFFSVYSQVGFTQFLFYLLGSCIVSF